MREIKVKGKTPEGEWIEGLLLTTETHNYYDELETRYYIVDESQLDWSQNYDCLTSFGKEVILETVGQYTGLRDINEQEIYEGDQTTEGLVIFEEGCFWLLKDKVKTLLRDKKVQII